MLKLLFYILFWDLRRGPDPMDSPHKSVTALLHSRRSSSRLSINAYGTQRIHTRVCIILWRKTVRHTVAHVLDDDFASAATATKYFRTCLSGRVRSILWGFIITADTRCREQGGLPRFHSLCAVVFFFICEHAASSSSIRILLCTNRVSFMRTLRNNTGGYGGYPIWSREFPATHYLLLWLLLL